jgi:hypothetical protein
VKCDRCDEEFETEAELDRHKAEVHSDQPVEELPAIKDEELEEPAYKKAANE